MGWRVGLLSNTSVGYFHPCGYVIKLTITMSLFESARGLLSAGSDLYGYDGDCCPPVVDPYTYLALLTGIALVTWFLQMTIVMTMFMPPEGFRSSGKRKSK